MQYSRLAVLIKRSPDVGNNWLNFVSFNNQNPPVEPIQSQVNPFHAFVLLLVDLF
jgi:hypothetical protein